MSCKSEVRKKHAIVKVNYGSWLNMFCSDPFILQLPRDVNQWVNIIASNATVAHYMPQLAIPNISRKKTRNSVHSELEMAHWIADVRAAGHPYDPNWGNLVLEFNGVSIRNVTSSVTLPRVCACPLCLFPFTFSFTFTNSLSFAFSLWNRVSRYKVSVWVNKISGLHSN